jgi:trimethylamine--corrinoid protein Co-methyltransferase
MTPAGGIALGNAGDLVGVVLAQLKREGAPVIISGGYHYVFGMLSHGGGPGAPPRTWGHRPEVCHYYDLPAFGLGGGTGAHVVDTQAGVQMAWTLMIESLTGANIVHDVGYMSGANQYSLQTLVIGDELIEAMRRFMGGMVVNEETLALDVIDEVGPDGHYLAHDHTMKHFRKEWYPQLLSVGKYTDWVAAGSKTMAERASDRVDEILAEHQPEPLSEDIVKQLDAIVERAAAGA